MQREGTKEQIFKSTDRSSQILLQVKRYGWRVTVIHSCFPVSQTIIFD